MVATFIFISPQNFRPTKIPSYTAKAKYDQSLLPFQLPIKSPYNHNKWFFRENYILQKLLNFLKFHNNDQQTKWFAYKHCNLTILYSC